MTYEKLEFVDAIERLAERAGIQLNYEGASINPAERARTKDRKAQLYEVMAWAQKWFSRALFSPEGKLAQDYLKKRELPKSVVQTWGIGYAPDSFDRLLIEGMSKFGDAKLLDECGLTRVSDQGKRFDFFRNRLLFPIRDRQSRVVAFGARKLREEDLGGKYINSPAGPIYDKARVLYGMDILPQSEFNRARPANQRLVVIVEGYMDVIACHRAGVDCAVAPCGTAITPDQLRTLSPYAPRLVLLMDGDAAGQASMERIAGEVAAQGLNVLAAAIPDGKDPDEYLRLHGPEGFGAILDGGIDLFRFKLKALGRRMNLNNPAEKRQAVGEVLEIVSAATDPVLRAELLRRTAEFFNTPESGLGAALRQMRPRRRDEAAPIRQEQPTITVGERGILMRFISHPTLIRPVGEFMHPEDFTSPPVIEVARVIFNTWDEYGPDSVDQQGHMRADLLLDHVPQEDRQARRLMIDLLEGDFAPPEPSPEPQSKQKNQQPEEDEFDLDRAVEEIRHWHERRSRPVSTNQAAQLDRLAQLRARARR